MWCILATVVVIALGYWFLIRPHKYWTQRGVKQGNPRFILGENWGPLLRKQSFPEMIQMVYNMFPNTRYSGFYQFLVPVLVVRDPDLIKEITVKDFDHFLDHRNLIPDDADPLWAKNLFSLTGKKWRDMRSNLSPAFTSSKMKHMFSLISKSSEQLVNYYLKQKQDTIITVEMKDTFTRFANDVIANTAFGVECNSLEDRNNEFYLMGKEVTNFSGFWKMLKILGYFLVPIIYKIFKIPIFPKQMTTFFHNIIKSNIRSREKNGIVRPDMINLLLEARKNGFKQEEPQLLVDTGFATVQESEISKKQLNDKIAITDEDITAQALIFFFAGFETVSFLMCFMSYELAVNPDIQERLIQEVDETMEACQGKLTYETLLRMKYMDMVVSESLRKWPNPIAGDRVCTKSYTIEPKLPGEKPLHLEKNTALMIPTFGLHRDPQYYPEPERFNPERFSDENKANIKPYTYLPFGSGPRNCIGSRFALLETKLLFFKILLHFQFVPVQKTQIPLVICKKQINLAAEKGFWLGLKHRDNRSS